MAINTKDLATDSFMHVKSKDLGIARHFYARAKPLCLALVYASSVATSKAQKLNIANDIGFQNFDNQTSKTIYGLLSIFILLTLALCRVRAGMGPAVVM